TWTVDAHLAATPVAATSTTTPTTRAVLVRGDESRRPPDSVSARTRAAVIPMVARAPPTSRARWGGLDQAKTLPSVWAASGFWAWTTASQTSPASMRTTPTRATARKRSMARTTLGNGDEAGSHAARAGSLAAGLGRPSR